MNNTINLLRNKRNVKKSIKNASYATILIFLPIVAVLEKLGIRKWGTYDVPLTWSEFFARTPQILLFCLVLFIGVFLISLHYKEPKFVICKSCMKSFYEKNTKGNICPVCNASLESLDGFYDRNPELAGKQMKNEKQI